MREEKCCGQLVHFVRMAFLSAILKGRNEEILLYIYIYIIKVKINLKLITYALMLKHALFYTPSNSCLNMF